MNKCTRLNVILNCELLKIVIPDLSDIKHMTVNMAFRECFSNLCSLKPACGDDLKKCASALDAALSVKDAKKYNYRILAAIIHKNAKIQKRLKDDFFICSVYEITVKEFLEAENNLLHIFKN